MSNKTAKEQTRIIILILILVVLVVVWIGTSFFVFDIIKSRKLDAEILSVYKTLTINPHREGNRYDFLKKVVEEHGLDAGWRLLKSMGTPSASLDSYLLGEYLYEKFGSNSIKKCHQSFLLGCRSGVVRSAIIAQGLNAIEELKEIE